MPRPIRIDFPSARHHVMNRGARSETVFVNDATCGAFLDVLGRLPERFGVRVHGYALMPNHFHLLLESGRGNLSRAMQHLGVAFTAEMNRDHGGWDGPVFRGRFKNRLVEEEHYWMHLLAYLHLNPVRAHLVPTVDQARWTSHAAYVGAEPTPAWLTTGEMLGLFGGVEAYQEYVWEQVSGRFSGPPGFEPGALWSSTRSQRHPPPPPPPTGPVSPETALGQICEATGVLQDALVESRRGPGGNPRRWLAAWWLQRAAGLTYREIAEILGANVPLISRWIRRVDTPGPDTQMAKWQAALRAALDEDLRTRKG